MTGPGPAVGEGPMWAALGGALLQAATGPGGAVVVADPHDPVVGALAARGNAVEGAGAPAPGARVVPVAGAARVGVAAGLALAGRPAIAIAGGDVPALLPRAGGLVAVVGDARAAGAWWGAGWTLVQPAWADDVAPLLTAALACPGPVVLRVAGPALAGAPGGVSVLGTPRVLREGTAGLLAASGPARTGLLLDVARMLADRGIALQAVELHTAGPGEGPGPEVTDRALLLGGAPLRAQPAHPCWPRGLVPVPVGDEAGAAAETVAARLPARPG